VSTQNPRRFRFQNAAETAYKGGVRWHYRDAGLLWPFVPAYAIHVAEEWFGGFPAWLGQIVGSPMPGPAFLIINAVAFVLLIAAIRWATQSERSGWMAVAVATIFLANTLAHAAGSAMTRSYGPGLISAVVLYVPLGSLAMIRAIDQADRAQVSRGVLAGLAIHALVFALAWGATL
jgi:hypothetical protein